MYGGEEVASSLIIARGDSTELLESGEEVLDQVARLEQVAVVVAADFPVGLGRDHHGLTGHEKRINDPLLGIERLIGDQRLGLHRRQQFVGTDEIMFLAAGQGEANRIAERIDQRVDFGAQSAARAADRLVLAGFFWAPALC
jgi:hypothetical protein